MSAADRQVLAAIKRNPYPHDTSLTMLAQIAEGLLDTVDALNAKVGKLETLVETLIEESAAARSSCPCEVAL